MYTLAGTHLCVRKKFWLRGLVSSNLKPSNTSGFKATATGMGCTREGAHGHTAQQQW
jgi:hypothetical protein